MSYEFAVGTQVVCVDNKWKNERPPPNLPVLNGIYTIREIIDWGTIGMSLDGGVTFLLEEVHNPKANSVGFEYSFYDWHFRPVKKTDISTFTEMTQNIPKPRKYIYNKPKRTLIPILEPEDV